MKSYNDSREEEQELPEELLRHLESLSEPNRQRNFSNLKIAVIVLCAGRGERMGLPYNKLLYSLGGETIVEMTVRTFSETDLFSQIICTASNKDLDAIDNIVLTYKAEVYVGGETRTDSVRRALKEVDKDTDVVLVHDGARPFVSRELIEDAIECATIYGSGIPALPMTDAVKVVRGGVIVEELNRDELYRVQTPQAFRYNEIMDAYSRIPGCYADDSEVYRLAGYSPHIFHGADVNRKITTFSDVSNIHSSYKVGYGYDVHKLVHGRDLVLGGVYVPYEKGLLGHSDADVLVHAIMDALLSASGMPDIGVLFPDTDAKYEGISSLILLARVAEILKEKKMKILSISAVIMAERPKMANHIPHMINCLSRSLGVSKETINISATTTEKLGIVGEGKGIASCACALVGT